MAKRWCSKCGRQWGQRECLDGICSFCRVPLTFASNSPLILERMRSVTSYVDGLTSALAKETGFTQYFCLKILMSFPKELFAKVSTDSDYLREQQLFEFICEGGAENLESFLEGWNRLMDYKVDAYLFRRMIEPDIYCIVDAVGRRIEYSWEEFERDLRFAWPRFPDLAEFTDLEDLIQHLVELYTRIDADKFFELIYRVHDFARQTEYWAQHSGRSIVTVRSKVGRRAPGWGWE